MKGRDFRQEAVFRTDAATLYRAVATCEGIRGWWTQFTEFDDRAGSTATMRFPDNGFYARMEVLALEEPRLVHWRCVDAEHPPGVSNDPRDWIGTEVVFEIEPVSEQETHMLFVHRGLMPLECAEVCRSVWDHFINTSLRKLVETGEGEPAKS